jgi:diguanylate cyclase (GGDEF)-like protein
MWDLGKRYRVVVIFGIVILAQIALKTLMGFNLLYHAAALEQACPWADWAALAICAGAATAMFYRRPAAAPDKPWLAELPALPAESDWSAIERLRLLRRDPLTDLPNLRMFDEVTAQRLASQEKLAMLLLDIDRFHTINDNFGLRAGDKLLQDVGDRLRGLIAGSTAIAHIFSDRFGILTTVAPRSNAAEQMALALMHVFKDPFSVAGTATPVSVSIGISRAPDDGQDVTTLMQSATRALHAVKGAGGGKWRFHNTGSEESDADLRHDLPVAIAVHQIKPYYQPIVDLISGAVVGLEVLARWDHPVRGMLSPDRFIDMAEKEGHLNAITADLLAQVTHDVAAWPEALFVSFNITASQLREFAAHIVEQKKLVVSLLPASRIEVELTEDVLTKDIEVTREVVRLLHELGTRVVLDDFGTGAANFNHLRGIMFDRLKIDKDFVLDLLADPRAEVCVRSIADLGRVLGMDVVAKGVSSAEIAARVSEFGCQFGQGSLFSMPVPAASVAALLAELEQRHKDIGAIREIAKRSNASAAMAGADM